MAVMRDYIKTDTGIFKLQTDLPIALGVFAKSANKIDYNGNSKDIRNEEIVLLNNSLGIEEKNIIMLNQVHGDSIIRIDNAPGKNTRKFVKADGIITGIRNLCLVIRSADCVPVFAFDINKRILGAVHSGWKGCRLNISKKLIKNMKTVYRSKNEDIFVFILPSIGKSYEVNMDVGSYFHKDIVKKNNKIYLNLWQNIERSLSEEGIPEKNVFQSGICTYDDNDFFSYRGGDIGRNLNFGYITSG